PATAAAIVAASASATAEAASSAKAAAAGQSAARFIPHVGAIESLGALDVRAGKSGDLVPAVLVRQLDEDVEVAVGDLIGAGGAKKGAGDLKTLDRGDLVVPADGLACFGQQRRTLCRVLRVSVVRSRERPDHEHPRNSRR